MGEYKVQIQSVLYENDKESIERAICNIDNAIRCFRNKQGRISCSIKYGDASPNPVFTEEQIKEIQELYSHIENIDYIFFNENTGTAKGHNILAKDCKQEYIMILNPDVLINPDFFVEMLKPFDEDQVGMTEARQTPIEHPKEYDINTFETGWSTTACVIFRKKIYNKIHGFDEKSFFMYCDDVDFSWRIRLCGYKLIYCPRAVVYHAKRLSGEGGWQPTKAERYYSAEAALFMAYKWSQNDLLHKLVYDFKHSKDEVFKKAVEEFERRKKNGALPKQIDKDHKVGMFVDGGYAYHRFNM